ncbi:putative ribosomal protein L34Ae [Tanacetum coccineum]
MKKLSSFFDVDDSLKEKKARKEDDADAVSISTMAKTIKESMTVFWDIIYTGKDTTKLFLTIILQGSKAHLQDPADSELAERWIRITGSLTPSCLIYNHLGWLLALERHLEEIHVAWTQFWKKLDKMDNGHED